MKTSTTHLVLIPTYNTGKRLLATVRDALKVWRPVWVVIDGSTDGSGAQLHALAESEPALRVIELEHNRGKGGAVLAGATAARHAGFTHALVMDADGQHPTDRIADFMEISGAAPDALILGRPVFGPDAPQLRLQGRKLSIAMARLQILGDGIDDPLFGFRVYPLTPLVTALQSTSGGRRYDFDPEMAVRMYWAGVPTRNVPAVCRYFGRDEGGVSHFRYFRDNVRLFWLNTRLTTELLLWRWFSVWRRRRNQYHQAV